MPANGSESARIRLERRGRRADIALVAIPGGTFEMGSKAALDESPVRTIPVSTFFLAQYETTVTQAALVFGDDHPHRSDLPDGEDAASYPATEIDWHAAMQFCERIKQALGDQVREIRLPWEFEWEYAAKKGLAQSQESTASVTSRSSGAGILLRQAWIDEDPVAAMPHPVGRKLPDSLGIHDLFGNVEEWVLDVYDRSAYQRSEPRGRVDGEYGILRGGSCITPASEIRASRRRQASRTLKDRFMGFRIVVVP